VTGLDGAVSAHCVSVTATSAEVTRPLRVALDATPLLGQPTGIGVFCAGAIAALADLHDIDLQTFAVSWRRRGPVDARVPQGVSTKQHPMPARPLHWSWARSDRPPLEWFVGHVDVVHGTNFVVPPTSKAASIVSVHDLTPLHHPELCNPATLAYPELIRRAVRRGAWIHADSEFVAQEIVAAFPVAPERVRVVYPGTPRVVSIHTDGPGPASVNHVSLLPEGAGRYVLAVGTAEPRKDLPGLVRAFADIAREQPDLALVLAGPPGWGEEALDAAIEAVGQPVARRIVRTGWVDDQTLSSLLRSAAVLAYPSLYEGFGFPPLQAMSVGVPVVATTAGSLPEVLGDGAILVTPGDNDALGAALARVLTDSDEQARLATQGHLQAGRYTWSGCASGLAVLYQDAAADNGGGGRR
jgi:glycosyltransferase involved in cell wall biosynthesis